MTPGTWYQYNSSILPPVRLSSVFGGGVGVGAGVFVVVVVVEVVVVW